MKLKWRTTTALALIMIPVLVVLFCLWLFPEEPKLCQAEFPTMGTIAKVSVYNSESDLNRAFEICQQEFNAVSKLCSLYDPTSELSRINNSAAQGPIVCSPEMWALLMRSKAAYEETDGYFDITVKPLMDLWGFYRKRDSSAPSEAEITEVMKVVGFDKLVFDEKNRTILFSVPGMALDLGGIAKGYAVDRATAAIERAGIHSGVVDLGGNLKMLSQPPPGKNFYTVGIRDPKKPDSILPEFQKVPPAMAVSSSGDYERFVTYNGKRYGHLLSPKTGKPAAVSAVTVIAQRAIDADIYSTACSLGGENIANKLRNKHPRLKIIFTR